MKKLFKLFSVILAIVALSCTFVCVNADAKMSLQNETMDGSWSQSYNLESYNDKHTYDFSFTTDGLWNCVVESSDYVSWELRDVTGQRIKSEYLSGGSAINPVT